MKAKLLLLTSFCLFLFIGQAQTFDHVETFANYTEGAFTSSASGLPINWTATNTSGAAGAIILAKNNGTLVSGSIASSISNLQITLNYNGNPTIVVTISDGITPKTSSFSKPNSPISISDLNFSTPFTITLESTSNQPITVNTLSWNEYGTPSIIYNIQYTTTPGVDGTYPSLKIGKSPSVSGTVTGVNSNGYYIQDADGDWNGIWIADNSLISPARLDEVSVTGKVIETNGRTEIGSVTFASINSVGTGSAPNPTLLIGALEEKDESVVSQITYSRYKSGSTGNYIMNIGFNADTQFHVDVNVDNNLGYTPSSEPTTAELFSITGPVNYASSTFHISPSDNADFVNTGVATNNGVDKINSLSVTSFNHNILVKSNEIYTLEVYNLAGQKVKALTGNEGRIEISMEKGVYIVKLNTANASVTEKVLVK